MSDTTQVVDQGSNANPVTDSATGSQNGESKYSKYFELNGMSSGAGTSDEKPGKNDAQADGVKPADTQKEPAATGKPPVDGSKKKDEVPEGQRGWSRRVEVLTAREHQHLAKIKELQAEIEIAKGKKPDDVKLTEDHFKSKEDYEDWKLERKLEARDQQRRTESLEKELESEKSGAFKTAWQPKVEKWYPTPEARAEYSALLKTAKSQISADMHDFVQASDLGPVMLEWLVRNPDQSGRLAAMKPVVLGARLLQLEQALGQALSNEGTTKSGNGPSSPPRQTNAPGPIGSVSQRGGAQVSDDDGSIEAVKRYLAKNYGNRR